MSKNRAGRLADLLSDHFSSLWQLLSETTVFLSRTAEFDQYEKQLRDIRARLQSSRKDQETLRQIRSELTELRRHLRLSGYDLSLGSQNLVFDGFRHDDCMREGFRRIVLFIAETQIYWLTGEDNHVTLAGFLEQQLENSRGGDRHTRIKSRHYLWYRRGKTELILSGADTEIKEDYETLKAIGEVNPLFFLSQLKTLR